QSDEARLQQQLARAEKALANDEPTEVGRALGFAADDVDSLQKSKDTAAEVASEAAAITAGIIATAATGGLAAPGAVSAMGAVAGGTAGAGAYWGMENGAADSADIWKHGAIGAVTGATSVVTPGMLPGVLGVKAGAQVAAKEGLELAAKEGLET